jgi:hypothetical protein
MVIDHLRFNPALVALRKALNADLIIQDGGKKHLICNLAAMNQWQNGSQFMALVNKI